MWRAEADPRTRSTGVLLEILDREPDWDRLAAAHDRVSQQIPRLRERAVDPLLPLFPPSWSPDPHFDLGYHLQRVRLPEPGTMRQLLDLAQGILARPLDKARPPWEAVLVEGLEDGRAWRPAQGPPQPVRRPRPDPVAHAGAQPHPRARRPPGRTAGCITAAADPAKPAGQPPAPAARRCAVRADQARRGLPQAHRPHGAEPRCCRRRHDSVRSLVAPGSHAAADQTVAAAARRRRRRLPVRPARCAVERPEGRGEGGWRLGERRLPGRPARSVPALPRAPRHPGRPDADRDPGLAAHQRRPDGRQPVRRRDSPPRSGKPTPAPASRSSGSSSSPPGPNPPSGSSTSLHQR